jgi:hypothetical protein
MCVYSARTAPYTASVTQLFVGAKSAVRVGLARGTGGRHEKGEDAGDRGRP